MARSSCRWRMRRFVPFSWGCQLWESTAARRIAAPARSSSMTSWTIISPSSHRHCRRPRHIPTARDGSSAPWPASSDCHAFQSTMRQRKNCFSRQMQVVFFLYGSGMRVQVSRDQSSTSQSRLSGCLRCTGVWSYLSMRLRQTRISFSQEGHKYAST